jgi:uncharacterized protein (DUF1697 family)
MAHVVFFRAANVGGRNAFRPARLAADLAHLDVASVGAAGTFVVRGKATEAAIRREILARLPFEPGIVIRPAREILALVASEPFRGVSFSRDLRGWVAALAGEPKALPKLPLASPRGKDWSVRLDRVVGGFAIGLSRRRPGGSIYPSDVLEDALGVAATTRWWETVQRLAVLLESHG